MDSFHSSIGLIIKLFRLNKKSWDWENMEYSDRVAYHVRKQQQLIALFWYKKSKINFDIDLCLSEPKKRSILPHPLGFTGN